MKRVRWAEAATSDLTAIRDYLTETYSGDYAQFVIDRLILSTRWLLDHPSAGATIDHSRWRKWKPRRTRYILVYEATAGGIDVVRVHHDRNDWRRPPK